MLGHLLPLLANGWTAYSLAATLMGGAGVALLVAAFVATAYLPAFVRHALIIGGAALIGGSALYQAGQAKGAHDAFARDAARAVAAEAARAEAANRITDRIAAQAARDLASERAATTKLQEINDALRKDSARDRECVDRGLARRLRAL